MWIKKNQNNPVANNRYKQKSSRESCRNKIDNWVKKNQTKEKLQVRLYI